MKPISQIRILEFWVHAMGIFILLQAGPFYGQIHKAPEASIDSLFATWSRANHPGGVVGIMQDGKAVYTKAFGLSSLEYSIPVTAETTFNTGSLAKQVTARDIAPLAHQSHRPFDFQTISL
jgi:CubicO group peptidase (beta-lactamase class C family)